LLLVTVGPIDRYSRSVTFHSIQECHFSQHSEWLSCPIDIELSYKSGFNLCITQ